MAPRVQWMIMRSFFLWPIRSESFPTDHAKQKCDKRSEFNLLWICFK